MKRLVMLCSLGLASLSAWGHGDLDVQIESLTKRIGSEVPQAGLYLQRGVLYLQDGMFKSARRDLEQVLKLDAGNTPVHYHLGEVALQTGRYQDAVVHAQAFIQRLSESAAGGLSRGYGLLGDAQLGSGAVTQAAVAYELSLAHNADPRPADFLRLAEAYIESKSGQEELALNILDKGIERLGPIAVLQEPAIEIETELGRYPQALTRMDTLHVQGIAKAIWHRKRATIYQLQHNRRAESELEAALIELDSLPPQRRNLVSVQQVRDEIVQAQKQLVH